jgi:hypothetical protein
MFNHMHFLEIIILECKVTKSSLDLSLEHVVKTSLLNAFTLPITELFGHYPLSIRPTE